MRRPSLISPIVTIYNNNDKALQQVQTIDEQNQKTNNICEHRLGIATHTNVYNFRQFVCPSVSVCVLFSIYIHWKSFNDCHWVLKCHCLFLPNEEKILSSDRFWRYQKLYSEFHERDSLVSVGVSVRPWPRLRSFIRHVVEQRQTPTQTSIRINYIKLNWS